MNYDASPKVHLANAKPNQTAHREQLDRESSRLFIGTLSHGILVASRQTEEAPAAKQLVKDVSRKGAEFVVNIVANGHKMPHPVELGRRVHALQIANHHMFPDFPYVDNPNAGVRQPDLVGLLSAHADRVGRMSDGLPDVNRPNREDAALAVLEIMSTFIEENPSGLQLDPQASEQLEYIAKSYDAAYPPES